MLATILKLHQELYLDFWQFRSAITFHYPNEQFQFFDCSALPSVYACVFYLFNYRFSANCVGAVAKWSKSLLVKKI